MKNLLMKLCSLFLCAAALCAVPAFAAEGSEVPARLGPVRVWGSAAHLENGSLFLRNSSESDPNREIIVHLSEETFVVDAMSGLPMRPADIRDGETVYAWVGPAMMLSLPPQAAAQVVVANIPADFGAPMYHQAAAVEPQATSAAPLTQVELTAADGTVLTITDEAELMPWRTKNLIRLEDLVPGSRFLVWRDAAGAVSRVVVFPYAYRGYVEWTESGAVALNGQPLAAGARRIGGRTYLPVRAVAEAAGYTVSWDRAKGAVVTENGDAVFSACPDSGTVLTTAGERGLRAPCLIASGVTYLPAGDLAELLDQFAAP